MSTPNASNPPAPRPNYWLKHIHPELFGNEPNDPYQDLISYKLEYIISEVAATMIAQWRIPLHDARQRATSLVANEMLGLQRENCPESVTAMFAVIAAADPLVEPFRADLVKSVQSLTKQAVRTGILIGSVLSAVVTGMILLAVTYSPL